MSHSLQHELHLVMYPVFVHCYLDLVLRDFPEDGSVIDDDVVVMFGIIACARLESKRYVV